MIGYTFSRAALSTAIERTVRGWLEAAKTKTENFRQLRRYEETAGTWSAVKSVFMDFQHNKCPYCERKLESNESGKIEWDVEHFRPKNAISRWPPDGHTAAQSFNFPTGPASGHGYYLLAYHPLNYLASCKVCNSTFKSDYFPIASKRRSFREGHPQRLLDKERAYVPYPLGDFDEAPETLLTFQGYICVPTHTRGHRRNRAILTIELFGLNTRDTLLQDRAEIITFAYAMLKLHEADPSSGIAADFLLRLAEPGFRHANCARSFVQTFRSDRALAEQYAAKSSEYLRSKGS